MATRNTISMMYTMDTIWEQISSFSYIQLTERHHFSLPMIFFSFRTWWSPGSTWWWLFHYFPFRLVTPLLDPNKSCIIFTRKNWGSKRKKENLKQKTPEKSLSHRLKKTKKSDLSLEEYKAWEKVGEKWCQRILPFVTLKIDWHNSRTFRTRNRDSMIQR